jgi:aminoglycoside phosphotransferase (APT) family kinase protein
MAERHEVLAALTRALSEDELRLQFVAPDRLGRRSTVYFVGLHDEPARCRWVVKSPHSNVVREDLPPPASAALQFAALSRAAEHLASDSDQLATPRPVALLPEIDAYAMAYASGESLSRRIRIAAVVRPARLLEGVAAAASIIRSLHGLEPAREMSIDLRTAVRRSLERSRAALEPVGLPAPFAAPLDPPERTAVIGKEVLLHGDFAPENVLLTPGMTTCLEPDLVDRGLVEQDLARFLTMLFEAPLFVVGAYVPAIQRLRRRAGQVFIAEYYERDSPSPVLPALLYEALAVRCAARYVDCARRRPPAHRLRLHLLRTHFRRLLSEVARGAYHPPRGIPGASPRHRPRSRSKAVP